MSFFDTFPKILYNFDIQNNNLKLATDIFSRISLRQSVLDNVYAYYKYQLQDGDTPEIISQKEYNSPHFHWIICYVNGLRDPVFDFPLSRNSLERYIVKKYDYSDISNAYIQLAHYVLEVESTLNEIDGRSTTTTTNNIVSLTQFDYSTNNLILQVANNPTWSNTIIRANNANANSSIIATVNVKSTYIPVSVYEYEDQLNESKREIKLLKQEYVEVITNELSTVING